MFVVADSTMGQVIRAFLGRQGFHLSLGCGPFDFDAHQDIVPARGRNDPGLYAAARQFAAGARSSHEHLVVVLDAEWEGSPGAPVIQAGIEKQCVEAGWSPDRICAVVIEPELESWIWQDNPHVEAAVGHTRPPTLREALGAEGLWPIGAAKPPRPKETLQSALRRARIPWSASIHAQIAGRISTKGCTDVSFQRLVEALRNWFPAIEP